MRNAVVAGVSKASCAFTKKLGAKSCLVLYNGVDTKFFGGSKSHKGVQIAYVGRLIKEKGVQDLLKAVKGIKASVVIIGKGPLEKELRTLGGKFVGEKDSAGVRQILASSDILVNPSYGEGLPTAVLEAGAMGLAVVATDVGGTSEIISDGKNGFLVHPGNIHELREKLALLVKNSKLKEEFGKALQKTVREKFDWNKVADKFEKVLKSL
jgi:glycosyltransferase involved in cell wall biosynthesis